MSYDRDDDDFDPASLYRTFADVKKVPAPKEDKTGWTKKFSTLHYEPRESTAKLHFEHFEPLEIIQPTLERYTYTTEAAISAKQSAVNRFDKRVQHKRIVICCDGTWQSSVTGLKNIPSNVTRLARSIARSAKDEDGNIWQQVVYYDAGIGSGEISVLESARAGGFGVGFVGNVVEAYSFIVNNYRYGDKIYCFGFSRGAYTARAVAGLVTDIGIISPQDLHDFPDLFEQYQKHDNSFAFRQSHHYREWITGVRSDHPGQDWIKPPRQAPPEISRVVEVIGVFDTVGSLGIPELTYTQSALRWVGKQMGWNHGDFHNIGLSPFIKHAYHALALDERRKPFTPSLWQYPSEEELSPPLPEKSSSELLQIYEDVQHNPEGDDEEQKLELMTAWEALVKAEMYAQLKGNKKCQLNGHRPELQQVWFPGVHINVGGGDNSPLNGQECDYEQIALISFAWMCERIAPHLLLNSEGGDLGGFAADAMRDRANIIRAVTSEKDFGQNAFSKTLYKGLEKVGAYAASMKTVSDVVENGWARGVIVDSFAGMMKLGKSLNRSPGEYKYDKAGNKPGVTCETIHPTVTFRREKVDGYNPPALAGFKRSNRPVQDQDTKEWRYEWRKEDVVIPEFVINKEDIFSRRLAEQDKMGLPFLRSVDDELRRCTTV